MLNFTALDSASVSDDIEFSAKDLEKTIDYSAISTGNLIVDEATRQAIEQSFLCLSGHPQAAENLAFGGDAWRVKIAPNLIKTSVVASALIGLLHATGVPQFAALALPAVLPLLIEIDTIRLSVKDNIILSEMRLNSHIKYGENAPLEIYRQLSADTQENISYGEFLETLDALNIVGHTRKNEERETYYLNAQKRFSIIFE